MDLRVLSKSRAGFFLGICLFIILRSYESSRTSCFSAPCTKNRTIFDNSSRFGCYCDEACYKTFFDCCPDYEKYCGNQNLSEPGNSMWKCIQFNIMEEPSECSVYGATGVWMISKCPAHWSFEELRKGCENTPSEFSGRIDEAHLPVVGANFLTYRNEYCAFCNGVKYFTSWNIKVVTELYVEPRKEYDLNTWLEYIDNETEGMNIKRVLSATGQPQRLCFGENYIEDCVLTDNSSVFKACIEGPIQVVTHDYLNFKNEACAQCNGFRTNSFHQMIYCPQQPKGFTIELNLRKKTNEKSITFVSATNCPSGTVFDTSLHFCRKEFNISSGNRPTGEYMIVLWFAVGVVSVGLTHEILGPDYDFKLSLMSFFSLESNQISGIHFHRQNSLSPLYQLYVATFHLTLTPFQSLIMANHHKAAFNVREKSAAFLKLFNHESFFELTLNRTLIFVIRLRPHPLACNGEVRFQSNSIDFNRKVDEKNSKFVVDKTGKAYSLDDYTLVKEKDYITLCRKLVILACREDACVSLQPDEYEVLPNFSVYQNATGNVFGLGEYLIYGKERNYGNPETFNISNSQRNLTIATGHGLTRNNISNETATKYQNINNTTRYGLHILTLIGFIVSVVLLMLLLVTFGLFRELRTVPGMNLMNLSFSMLLSDLIWLIRARQSTGTTTCKVFAILEHYLFQVSFLAMSVISYHSCLVFSRLSDETNLNTSLRSFIRYSAVVWLSPAIFVAICVTLDETEAFQVDYGTNCWLGTVKGILYLFLLPLAISLLYNIYTFIKTARLLLRHDESRDILQHKEGKQNLLICIKLASCVGLPWLFAFLGVLFPDEEAFEYLLTVFVCLQGWYVGMAFLFNNKTLNLYKSRFNRVGPSLDTPPTVEMTPASGLAIDRENADI